MSRKKVVKPKPLVKLTPAQRKILKDTLDGLVVGAGLARVFTVRIGDEFDQAFAAKSDRHLEILKALDVLGIQIEGHEVKKV